MSVENGIDKDLLDTLTPEERAAIEDQEFSPEELAAMKGIAEDGEAGGGDDDNQSPESKTDDKTEQKADEKPPVAAEPAEKKPDAAAPEQDPEREAVVAPTYNAQLPADYDEQVAALKSETRALADKFKAGELEFDDYQAQLDQLNERRDQLAEIRLKASISEEMKEQTQEQLWHSAVNRFVTTTARTEGIDYAKDTEKQADLDAFVKTLASSPKNSDKSFDWFLTEAHKRVKALHGIADKKEDPSDPPKKDEPTAKPTRKPPLEAAPKTLAHVPGSDGPGDVGGEFADLDALEGMELEQALAKLSSGQRERYLKGE